VPYTATQLVAALSAAEAKDDDQRWLFAMLADTGARLSEVAGLALVDIDLDSDVPHIVVKEHPWRPKTRRGQYHRNMNSKTFIAPAGNVLPGALASLRSLGFTVSFALDGQWQADSESCIFRAEDPLTLLGLVKFYELRGKSWRPTDAEVDEYLAFDSGGSGA
jgi:hypothetical protein